MLLNKAIKAIDGYTTEAWTCFSALIIKDILLPPCFQGILAKNYNSTLSLCLHRLYSTPGACKFFSFKDQSSWLLSGLYKKRWLISSKVVEHNEPVESEQSFFIRLDQLGNKNIGNTISLNHEFDSSSH